MIRQLEKYRQMLIDESAATAGKIGLSGQNDKIFTTGNRTLATVAREILKRVDCAAVIVASPLHPFAELLFKRLPADLEKVVPEDSESRSSLHDIPFIRQSSDGPPPLDAIAEALSRRKGCFAEGIGIISHGYLTTEQAYVAWSSLLHALTVMYLQTLLEAATPPLQEELNAVNAYYSSSLETARTVIPPLTDKKDLLSEMIHAGKATVRLGLVDSFFGNISCLNMDKIFISQTSARLDQLAGQIDCLTVDGSSTSAITASSELPAHQAVIAATGCKVLLHGHPKFSVVMSLLTEKGGSDSRFEPVGDIPVVGGEGGVGGMAVTLPSAFCKTGSNAVIVRGHGLFALSHHSPEEAVYRLLEAEMQCMRIYFERLAGKTLLQKS